MQRYEQSIPLDRLIEVPYAVIIPDRSLFPQIPAGMHATSKPQIERKVRVLIDQIDALDTLLQQGRVNLSAETRMHFLAQRDRQREYAEESGSSWNQYAHRLESFRVPEATFFSSDYEVVYRGFKRMIKLFERASEISKNNPNGAAYAALFSLVDPNEPQIFLTRDAAQQQMLAMLFEFAYSSEIGRNAPSAQEVLTVERMLHSPKLYVGEPDELLQQVSTRTSTVTGLERTVSSGMIFDYAKHDLVIDPEGKKLFRDSVYGILVEQVIKACYWQEKAKDGIPFSADSYTDEKQRAEALYNEVRIPTVKFQSRLRDGSLRKKIRDILEVRDAVEGVPEVLALVQEDLARLRHFLSGSFRKESYAERSLTDELAAKGSKRAIKRLYRLQEIAHSADLLDGTGDTDDPMHKLYVDTTQHMEWIAGELEKHGYRPEQTQAITDEERPTQMESIDDRIHKIDVPAAEGESIAEAIKTAPAENALPAYELDDIRKQWVDVIYHNLRHLRESSVEDGTEVPKRQFITATTYSPGGVHLIIKRGQLEAYWSLNARKFTLTRSFVDLFVRQMHYEPIKFLK